MKLFALNFVLGVAILLVGCIGQSETITIPLSQATIQDIKSVADGHFLVNMELQGIEQRINLRVQNNIARSVNSTDSRYVGLSGQFQLIGNGVFMIGLQGGTYRGTQFWVFNEDGTAEIKEVPDRGERQLAIPVDDDTLDRT